MAEVFSKSRWIWLPAGAQKDQYAEFIDTIPHTDGAVFLRLSCDSDYALFINDQYVASGQYGDFEHYKIYDTLDITPFLRAGENQLKCIVYHCGAATSRYCPAKAGLIYEVVSDDKIIGFSGEKTRCRQSPFYQSGLCRFVSIQLGYTFAYNAAATGDAPFENAALVDKYCTFYPRPIPRTTLLPPMEMKGITRHSPTHYLIDLGEEAVGLPHLRFSTEREQKITVAWGEHIAGGGAGSLCHGWSAIPIYIYHRLGIAQKEDA